MAAPRTSAEPPAQPEPRSGEGLSIQTLIIAALASATAAIVVSRVWDKGTIIASAMTPVIVAVVSEMLRKPMESDVVRRPVRAVGSVTASRGTWRRGEARPPSGRTPNVMAPPPAGVDEGLRQREEGLEPGPVRVYSSGFRKRPPAPGSRRRRHLKIAVVTGLVGFVIAAVALTLPELIFGGSVTGGKRDTTYFGGGSQTQKKGETQDGDSTDGRPDEPTKKPDETTRPGADQTAPEEPSGTETAPDSGGGAAPQQPAEPAPTTPAPVPTTPAPPAPAP